MPLTPLTAVLRCSSLRRLLFAGVLVGLAAWPLPARTADAPLPASLEQYLDLVRPTAGERRRLLAGEPLAKLLETHATEQVSVLGAVWIEVPIRRYLDALRRIETWERGRSFRFTTRLGRPARLDDFQALRLSADQVEDLRQCRVGNCDMKLGAPAIEAFQTSIDWTSADRHATAERLMRQVLVGYSHAYVAGGNAAMPVLHDKHTPVAMGDEFSALVDDLPVVSPMLQRMRSFLVNYPHQTLPRAESFLYWQEAEFGLKPIIRISHMTLVEGDGEAMVGSKMIYANHYFRGAVELRLLMADPARGPGFWLLTINASRTDGMTGFLGLFVRPRVRSGARDGAADMMRSAKRRLETGR